MVGTYHLGYDRLSNFWNGVNPNDTIVSSYNNFSMSSSISALIIKTLSFREMLFKNADKNANSIFVSSSQSTFVSKKSTQEDMGGGLIWNYNPGYGYTESYFLLGKPTGYIAYGDTYAIGIGMSARASSSGTYYGTNHQLANGSDYNCGNGEGCLYGSNYWSSSLLGYKAHRWVFNRYYEGLFFR